jgi:hypothetical protein
MNYQLSDSLCKQGQKWEIASRKETATQAKDNY